MSPNNPDVAVLVTCHGTVEDVDDIPEFVRNIRRGHPAPDDVVAEVRRRFEAIGGSPLMAVSREQAAALERRVGVPVVAAGRLWGPFPEQVVAPLLAEGVKRVVSLPLAPQSVHIYNQFVARRLAGLGLDVVGAPSYGLQPKLIQAFADAIGEARGRVPVDARVATVLSAHSLPRRVIASGDPYQRDFEAMAKAVTDLLVSRGVDRDAIFVAYQSQGMGGGEWLGPDLDETFVLASSLGFTHLVMAPIGFVAEHVETLYDIDIEAARRAREHGFAGLVRMPPMNTRDGFIDALAEVVGPLVAPW